MKKLFPSQNITLGCDPELFVRKDGKIVGCERVIPKAGIFAGVQGVTVIDGVQAELHPQHATCREILIRNIRACLTTMNSAMGNKFTADFSQTVEIDKAELDALDDEHKKFGCSESLNEHKEGVDKVSKIDVDPLVYLKRSAGGHIHIGAVKTISAINEVKNAFVNVPNPTFALLKDPATLIPVLDILVGNTCVLLDRDEGNIERRKNYGKAGEYRLPSYGIEYRTLSNFWLRGSPLASLVFGLARMAVNLCEQSTPANDYRTALMKLVNMKDIVQAINTNDKELARENFERIVDFLLEIVPDTYNGFYALEPDTLKYFNQLAEKGIENHFNPDTMQEWLNPAPGHGDGFFTFSKQVLAAAKSVY